MVPESDEALIRVIRDEGRLILATLARLTGSLEAAEDAVQDASILAMRTWRDSGIPPNPRAWLIVTAKNRALDVLRRESSRTAKEKDAMDLLDAYAPDPQGADAAAAASAVRDDQLRLIFLCCHPALDRPAQVALSLRILCGLSVADVAHSLLVPEATMAKRLTRARAKIRDAQIPYRIPDDAELPDRLGAVATVMFLLFNEGYASRSGPGLLRPELADEAVRLARVLLELMPGEAAVEGLLATMLLHHSRRDARIAADGALVLLADQDRTRWDRALADEGVELAASAVRRTRETGNRFVVTAAIAACHAIAATPADTDWPAIVSWYDVLITFDPSPVVRLNRAVALAEARGADVALAAVDELSELDGYPWLHATRAELLLRLGRPPEAIEEFDRALVGFSSATSIDDTSNAAVTHLRTRRADAARTAAAALQPRPHDSASR